MYLDDGDARLHLGDALAVLREMPDASADCCVTSPPYWGLRDYGVDGQIGLEETPEAYVAAMVDVFREVRRVLRPDGTLWLNLGDSYAGGGGFAPNAPSNQARLRGESVGALHGANGANYLARMTGGKKAPAGLKPKDLVGIPWRVAFALQADGWYLRSDIIWAKPNPMPESVTDRPTNAHEHVFLLAKRERYWFDQEAVREPQQPYNGRTADEWAAIIAGRKANEVANLTGFSKKDGTQLHQGATTLKGQLARASGLNPAGRNLRNVWSIATQPTPEAHFATFPQALVERCLKAGCPEQVCRTCGEPRRRVVERHRNGVDWNANNRGWTDCGHDDYRPGVVLDPFVGSGTTALVARRLGRRCVGIDLSAEYLAIAARRLQQLSLLAV